MGFSQVQRSWAGLWLVEMATRCHCTTTSPGGTVARIPPFQSKVKAKDQLWLNGGALFFHPMHTVKKIFFNWNIVDGQYFIIFRQATKWFDICIHYEMITVSLVTICPHTKLLQYYWPYSLCYNIQWRGFWTSVIENMVKGTATPRSKEKSPVYFPREWVSLYRQDSLDGSNGQAGWRLPLSPHWRAVAASLLLLLLLSRFTRVWLCATP